MVDSVSNRNEYQEYFLGGKGGRCVGLTPSCADCLEIWEPQPPGTLRACNGIALPIYSLQLIYASTFAVYLHERKKDYTRNAICFIPEFEGKEERSRLFLELISSLSIITLYT